MEILSIIKIVLTQSFDKIKIMNFNSSRLMALGNFLKTIIIIILSRFPASIRYFVVVEMAARVERRPSKKLLLLQNTLHCHFIGTMSYFINAFYFIRSFHGKFIITQYILSD